MMHSVNIKCTPGNRWSASCAWLPIDGSRSSQQKEMSKNVIYPDNRFTVIIRYEKQFCPLRFLESFILTMRLNPLVQFYDSFKITQHCGEEVTDIYSYIHPITQMEGNCYTCNQEYSIKFIAMNLMNKNADFLLVKSCCYIVYALKSL